MISIKRFELQLLDNIFKVPSSIHILDDVPILDISVLCPMAFASYLQEQKQEAFSVGLLFVHGVSNGVYNAIIMLRSGIPLELTCRI